MNFDKLVHKFVKYKGDSVVIHKKTDLHGTFYSAEKQANEVGVILCHGLTLVRKLFEPMALEIKKRGFDVLTFTFRGHGWRRKGKLTLKRALEDVNHTISFMQKHEKYSKLRSHEKVILVGHSLGALMSLKASLCEDTKKDIIALVLVGCPTSLAAAKIQTAAIFGAAKFVANVDVSEVLNQLEDFDSMEDIKRVKIPTLMVYGEFDEILLLFLNKPRKLKKKVKAANPGVNFEIIPGMFHNPINLLHKWGITTSAEKCHKLVSDWIQKHAA